MEKKPLSGEISHKLVSNYQNIRFLLDKSFTVKSLMQMLNPTGEEENALIVKEEMKKNNYNYAVIKNDKNVVYRYIQSEDLNSGTCKQHAKCFSPSDLVAESMPLFDLLVIFQNLNRVFVLDRNKVTGIVTRADLQKHPMRIMLFTLVNLLEMYLLERIRKKYPSDSFQSVIKAPRLQKAKCLFTKLKSNNEEIDLASCLELCDKRTICVQDEDIRALLGFDSKTRAEDLFKNIEQLRDNVAHVQDITADLPLEKLISAALEINRMLEVLETKVS